MGSWWPAVCPLERCHGCCGGSTTAQLEQTAAHQLRVARQLRLVHAQACRGRKPGRRQRQAPRRPCRGAAYCRARALCATPSTPPPSAVAPRTRHAPRGVALWVVRDPGAADVQQRGVLAAAGGEALGVEPGRRGSKRGNSEQGRRGWEHSRGRQRGAQEAQGGRSSRLGTARRRRLRPQASGQQPTHCVRAPIAPSSMCVTKRGWS